MRDRFSRACARGALRLYPRAWRERYAAEVAALLPQHDVTPRTVLDLLRGAADAHLHGDLLEGGNSMPRRVRASEIAIFCAVALFGLAWLPVLRVADPAPAWRAAVGAHPALGAAYLAVRLAGLAAALAVLAGGAPILLASLAGALRARRRDLLLLWATPLCAAAALAGYALPASAAWAATRTPGPDAPLTPLALVLQLGFVLLCLLAGGASVAAVALAVARSDLSARLLRLALAPAAVATAALGAGFAATLALGGLLAAWAPDTLAAGTLWPVLLLIVLLMAGACGLAAVALRRGLAAARGAAA
jgi:hypothetical protein